MSKYDSHRLGGERSEGRNAGRTGGLPGVRCPYCLENAEKFIRDARSQVPRCPNCQSDIPKTYLESGPMLRSTVGVVGFSGHGKTVFLTSLFSTLKGFSSYWSGYYFRSLDDFTHRIIYEQVPLFEKGALPESTPANFPNPALVHYHEIPSFGNACLGYYDTAGEVFSDVAQIARAGFFVAHSDVVLFIVSISDCNRANLDDEMSRLLDTYIRAADDRLNANIRGTQRMVVIFSKADLPGAGLNEELQVLLQQGLPDNYGLEFGDQVLDLNMVSIQIEEWLRQDLGCSRFPNMARDHFLEVRYTIVSALGNVAEDENGSRPTPLRVLDPFIWILDFARRGPASPSRKSLLDRLMDWLSGRKTHGIGPGKARNFS